MFALTYDYISVFDDSLVALVTLLQIISNVLLRVFKYFFCTSVCTTLSAFDLRGHIRGQKTSTQTKVTKTSRVVTPCGATVGPGCVYRLSVPISRCPSPLK